jgi:enoyl-CoA hydratase/carnithine racemase
MEVRLARRGRKVAIVTIDNQPRLNALTRAMLTELGRLWDELECDGSCRAIVLPARLGLINRVVERDQLMGWAIDTAERIAANSPSAGRSNGRWPEAASRAEKRFGLKA